MPVLLKKLFFFCSLEVSLHAYLCAYIKILISAFE